MLLFSFVLDTLCIYLKGSNPHTVSLPLKMHTVLFLLLTVCITGSLGASCDENKLSLYLKDKNCSRAPGDKVWNSLCGRQAAPSSGPNSPPLSLTTPYLVPPEPASQGYSAG